MKLEWNTGGWFGAQLGGTVWILVAAVLAGIRDIYTGLILLMLFAVPNIIGYMFWRKQSLSCYIATQVLVAIMGGCSLAAIYVLNRGQLWREIQTGGSISAGSAYYLVAAVIIIIMVVFYVRFGRNDD